MSDLAVEGNYLANIPCMEVGAVSEHPMSCGFGVGKEGRYLIGERDEM